MADDTEDYDIDESIRSFRKAGSRVIDGLEHLYHGGKGRIADRHVAVQAAISGGLWFAGNWVYNRTAPLVVESVTRVASTVSPDPVLALVVGFLGGDFALSTAQLLGVSTGALLGQNQFQTQRIKRIEANIIAMNETNPATTDGGTPDPEKIGGGGFGGAIAGASIGVSFGPGGVLAGAYLGYVLGERLTEGDVPDAHVERV